ncbi:MarR family winged helix-turn-helix transcriptional regulator [Nocardia yunnanensis]|uniref:MarR family winged helix-turn-helix transcriptional regulator n=1 Tax=Nocardia yunnanensis TaxID=2382165 RepID=UPI0013C4EB7E|nr:MarR family transcriptional regulator [Nocardia yunnanensis]
MTGERDALEQQLLDSLRRHAVDYESLRRAFAAWLALHPTDAKALAEIANHEVLGRQLTPAQLARSIHLSAGATSNLLNRLEHAGYVRRVREGRDGRKVLLHTGGQAAAVAHEFFDPLSARLIEVMDRYPVEQLRQIAGFLHEVHTTLRAVIADPPAARDSTV